MGFLFDPSYRTRLLALPALLARGGRGETGAAGQARGGRVEFHDHRGYVPGDDPRDIDWSLYLRLEQLAVKEYARSEAPEVNVILDRSASMGASASGKDRIAREVAGGVAWAALSRGAPTSLFVLTPGGPALVGRYHSTKQLDGLVLDLQELGYPEGDTYLGRLVQLKPAPATGRLTFLLSDFLVDPLPAAGIVALARGTGSGCLLHLVAESERHPRLTGATTLQDPESNSRLAVPDADSLTALYLQELELHEEAVAHLARGHALRHVVVDDSAPFEIAALAGMGRSRT